MSAAQPWNIATVSRLFEVRYGKANPGRDGKVPVIGSSGVYAWTDSPLVREPTIVVGRKGSAGQVWFIDKPCFPSDTTFYLVRRPDAEVDSEFAAYALRAHGVGASNDVIPSLQRHELENCEIPFPDRIEQRAIARILRSVETAIRVEAAICGKLAALKSATMAKLFREGLRGEPLKQTEIGEIPESWEVVRIGDHCTRMNYGTSQRCTTQLATTPVLRIPNIIHGTIETSDLKYAQPGDLTDKEIEKLRLEPGDLLFVRTNGNREYTGRCAVYEGRPEGALFASYLIRVRLSGDVLVPHFVQQFLSEVGREQIAGRANPAADGKFNIDTSILRSLAIPRPPKSEQQEIISILAALDERRRLAQEKSAALQRLFSSLLHALMTGAIRVKNLDMAEVSHA
ncbi:MAG TPA: restriction endonuclease subunit S [Bryobacteraceae bacterium]|nr:restriction endonuclease subunit S [Bryobacteraceae bacterium]